MRLASLFLTLPTRALTGQQVISSGRGRVDYGLKGDAPAASHWFFRSDSTTVRSGFRMRHGPAQVSWPRLCPQRYTGGTPAPGARIIHVNEYRIDHPVRKLGTRPAREPPPIHRPVAPGCRSESPKDDQLGPITIALAAARNDRLHDAPGRDHAGSYTARPSQMFIRKAKAVA